MEQTIRVLHVLGTTEIGGAESRIMDLYRHMDRSRIQFDFLVHTGEKGYYDDEINRLGGRIFRVPRFRLYNYFSYRRAVKAFFREHHEFQVVQGHITSTAAVYLPIAKKAGVPITVAHARSAGVDKGIKGKVTRWMRRNLSRRTDLMFTCSEIAGISVFGSRAVEEGKTIFIPNAIECSLFAYDENRRQKMRSELGLADNYVIGHVGRFHYAKNHEFLLRIFAELCRSYPLEDGREYALLLLGEGALKESARELAGQLGIAHRVHFLGNRGNAYDYYQAMDYFVYPSRYEGLPGTMIEAQTSGLRCLMSDAICKEAVVTELVKTMSLADEPGKWAEYLFATARYERKSHRQQMEEAGFDVDGQARIMAGFYTTGVWKEREKHG